MTGSISARHAEDEAVARVAEQSALLNTSVHVLDKALRNEVAQYANIFRSRLPAQFAVDADQQGDVAGTPAPLLSAGQVRINLNTDLVDSSATTDVDQRKLA